MEKKTQPQTVPNNTQGTNSSQIKSKNYFSPTTSIISTDEDKKNKAPRVQIKMSNTDNYITDWEMNS